MSEAMKRKQEKLSRFGIRLRGAKGRISIPGTNRSCNGISVLGEESIVQTDSPYFTDDQLCDHEAGHQFFFLDGTAQRTDLYNRCRAAYEQATTPEQRKQLLDDYLGKYKRVYDSADAKAQDKIYRQITEEILCDAYAGMNRDGAGADQFQSAVRPIIDEWCDQRTGEMGGAETGNTQNTKYSLTPEFEQWYKENFDGEDLTDEQLQRRLDYAKRKESEARESRQAAQSKRDAERRNKDLTAWMMYHERTMRAQRQTLKDRSKAVQQSQRARYEGKLQQQAEVNKARLAVARDAKSVARKRAAIETEQGMVDTLRKNPAERTAIEKLQSAASQLRTLGRSAYRSFVNQAMDIDNLARRQISSTRASTLVTVLGGSSSTVSSIYKTGLVDRKGSRIGDAMQDVFLCWDHKHKKVDQAKQALLQDYLLHAHNVDRMSFVDWARDRLETFEQQHPELTGMDTEDFARLVALTDAQKEKFKEIYEEQYSDIFERVIRSREYRKASDEEKAGLLEDARDDVLEETKDEFFEWLEENSESTPKKKKKK